MKFSRVGDHTIKCIITEQEIDDLGFSIEEILSNGARTQEFMNHIFDMAEQEFQMKFDLGIKTVRADFLPDHTISLTFSEHPVTSMTEHLKDIVNGLLNSLPQEKWAEMKKAAEEIGFTKQHIIVALVFDSMDVLGEFALRVELEPIPEAVLYKLKEQYFLVLNLEDYGEKDNERLSMLADEYASDLCAGTERIAHVAEHGKPVIEKDAIQVLRELYA